MSQEDIILRVRNVSQIFGSKRSLTRAMRMLEQDVSREDVLTETGAFVAVRDASFEVHRGEFFIIMGLSGCGKSTLLRAIIRLVEPSTGEIEIDGQDVMSLDSKELRSLRSTKIAMVFQRFGLQPHRSVIDNVEFGLLVMGMAPAERRIRATEAITQVGLNGWEDHYPNALSGGMQQRVGVARALARDPLILLMDEPFSGLDPLIRQRMQREFARLQAEIGLTIIMVTHDLDEALTLGDRIAIMRDGEIVQIATPEELVINPADDYIESFIEGASAARVFTARHIMDPDVITISTNDVEFESTISKVQSERERGSFVVDENRKLLGRILLHKLMDAARDEKCRAGWADQIEPALTTTQDATLAEAFPLVVGTRFPVAVVDDAGTLLGQITKNKLIETLMKDIDRDMPVTDAGQPITDQQGRPSQSDLAARTGTD